MQNLLDLPLVVWIVLIALSAFRVSWTLAREQGPFAVMDHFRVWLNKEAAKDTKSVDILTESGALLKRYKTQTHGIRWTLAELFNCPLCLGFWLTGIILVIFVLFPVAMVKLLIIWLALSGLQAIISLFILRDEV